MNHDGAPNIVVNAERVTHDAARALVDWAPTSHICQYGSRVYGTWTDRSDYDLIAIVPEVPRDSPPQIHNVDLQVYTEAEYHAALVRHEPWALEMYFLPRGGREGHVLHSHGMQKFAFQINHEMLRRSFSTVASHAWVKAKKKLIVEKDRNPHVACKSLFHAIRLPLFGAQLAGIGYILSYEAANTYWQLIATDLRNNDSLTWQMLDEKYRVAYKNACTFFREKCPL